MLLMMMVMQVAAAAGVGTPPADAAPLPEQPAKSATGEAVPACRVLTLAAPDGQKEALAAACGQQAYMLGQVDSYRSAYSAALKGLVVETVSGPVKRVLVVSPDADGHPHIEDVTRDLAKLSGRYAGAGLDQVDVDLSTFAGEGRIRVAAARRATRGAASRQAATDAVAAEASTSGASLDMRTYVGQAGTKPAQVDAQQGDTPADDQ